MFLATDARSPYRSHCTAGRPFVDRGERTNAWSGPPESYCSRRSATPESGAPCAFPPGVNGLAVREAPARDGGEERERNDRGEPVSEAARLLDKLL